MASVDPVSQWRERLGGLAPGPRGVSFPVYDKLGEGGLLSVGLKHVAEACDRLRWNLGDPLPPVKSSHGNEAFRLALLPPGKGDPLIVPLAAKAYAISRGTETWYSVSERVIGAARGHGSNIVFTFLGNHSSVRVTHVGDCSAEEGYLRFGERYLGWYFRQSRELEQFLRAPEAFSVQTRLSP